jgi:hypothetical protein
MKFTFNSVHAIVGTVVVALVSFSMQGKAYAGITPSISAGPTTATTFPGTQTWDFSGVIPGGVIRSGGAIVSGNRTNEFADPGIGHLGVGGDYLTVGGLNSNLPGAIIAPTATLTFTTALSHFGVFWGTPDGYNKLNFYNGSDLLASFVPGGTLAGLTASGINTDARYVDFKTDAGTIFDKVEFISSQAAFEVDNISYTAVPTPAMLPAIVGFGLAALKRRKLAAQA